MRGAIEKLLTHDDDEALAEHFARQRKAFDDLGLPIMGPITGSNPEPEAESGARRIAGWDQPLNEPGWRRTWGVRSGAREPIIAHLVLAGPDLAAELHRARVELGVEPAYQRRGFGEGLLRTGIAFAKDAGLAWLDLWVFGHNAPAQALYRKLGFVEVGRYEDQFRLGNLSVDDVAMALRLDR